MKRPMVYGDVAVVGVSCTYPGARNARQFWQNVLNKLSSVKDIEPGRFDASVYYDPDPEAEDKLYFKQAGILGTSFTFNPLKFGVPPNTIDGTEPDHFLVLRAVYEALDDAGYLQRQFSREKTSLILGKGNYLTPGCTWLTLRSVVSESVISIARTLRPDLDEEALTRLKKLVRSKLPRLSAENAAGLIPNIATGRVANRLDFMGRNSTVDAACASSLLATEDAIHNLLTYKDDMVITGGVHISTHVPFLAVFGATRAISPTSTIRPFDQKADGTIASEGIGILVLKRLADAERDGDRIYAIMKGVGSASDGKAKGLMAPRVEGEELALRRAYAMSGVDPRSVGLVEGHGTGTTVGDATEIEALRRVFGPTDDGRQVCALGSVKSNIGHAMPAAGAAGLIKTALSLYHRVLPPTINVEEPHALLLDPGSRFYLNTEARPWIHRQDMVPRRACVNAFGFGGINAHVVLEEYTGADESKQPSLLQEWPAELFIFEGEDRAALIARMEKIRAYVTQVEGVELRDVAYTLNCSLQGQALRMAIVADSFEQLATKIDRVLPRLRDPECRQIRERQGLYFFDNEEYRSGKLGFLFPGEGSQYLNMLSDLCMHFPVVRASFDAADTAIKDSNSEPPSSIIFPPPALTPGQEAALEKKLFSIERATEAVLTADGAIYRLLASLDLHPDMMTGHSAGEWIAMAVSGMVNIDEFIASMPQLAEMYRKLAESTDIPRMAMLAVGAGKERALQLAAEVGATIRIANDNCPHQVVVVTSTADSHRVMEHLLKNGVFVERLPYDRGYHTESFTYICDPLREFFRSLDLQPPAVPVVSCTTGTTYSKDSEEILEVVANTFARPLIFQETIERMYEAGVRVFVECGPRGNLTAFVDDILRGRPHLAIPVDQFRRPGLASLQHAAGMLAAAHREMDLTPLYARRGVRKLQLDVKADSVLPEERQPGAMQISLCYAELVTPGVSDFLQPILDFPATAEAAPPPAAPEVRAAAPPSAPASYEAAPYQEEEEEVYAPAFAEYSELPAGLLQDHFHLMEEFLHTQQEVVTSLLGRGDAYNFETAQAVEVLDEEVQYEQVEPLPVEAPSFPLLQQYEVIECAEEACKLRVTLDLAEHRYLLDHVLYVEGSEVNATGGRMTNMPLTGSLELICEAALLFTPGRIVAGLKNVSATRPIFVEEGMPPLQILLHLRRLDADRIHVAVRSAAGTEILTDAIVILADAFPAPEAPAPLELHNPKAPVCPTGAEIYDSHRMFHGPSFQGVHAINAVGENGLQAQLRVLPNDTCLASDSAPQYIIDPHLFDAGGQLVGYWPIEYFDTGIILLPIQIAEVTLYSPTPAPGTILDVRLWVREINERQMRADYDILLPDGTLWMRVVGWQDWRFHFERRYYDFFRFPNQNLIGRAINAPALQERGISCHLIDAMPEIVKPGLYEVIWTYSVLSLGERLSYKRIAGEEPRSRWLHEVGALKDVVRGWAQFRNRKLYSADVHVDLGPGGTAEVSGFWEAEIGTPYVAVAYGREITIAVAAGETVSVAVERVVPGAPVPDAAFVPEESEWIQRLANPSEWMARAIAAKKAVARFLRPQADEDEFWTSLLIPKLNEATGELEVADPGSAVNAEDTIKTFTSRDGEWIIAIALK